MAFSAAAADERVLRRYSWRRRAECVAARRPGYLCAARVVSPAAERHACAEGSRSDEISRTLSIHVRDERPSGYDGRSTSV
jgi:hypothetical protein